MTVYRNNMALATVHRNTPFVSGRLAHVPTPVQVAAEKQSMTDSSGVVAAEVEEDASNRDRKIILISVGAALGLILLLVLAVRQGWLKL